MLRETYHTELDQVIDQLVMMTNHVRVALRDATDSLLQPDLARAEQVISDDSLLDAMHDDSERRCFNLLARQSPVAGELRTVVAALRMTSELGRMGDLAAHIAKIARMRYPDTACPESLRDSFTQMAKIADDMISVAARTLGNRDAHEASKLADSDEAMDRLRRDQFRVLLDDNWNEGVEKAVDAALLGRYYERIADHAVSMGGRIIYLVTGETPEGEDWPRA